MISISELNDLFVVENETGIIRWRVPPKNSAGCRQTAGYTHRDTGYVKIMHRGKMYLAHRIIWAIANGKWPEGQIDHINGNRSDNRLSNLRDVTPSENSRNRVVDHRNKSGVIGVIFRRNRWVSTITSECKNIHLGNFLTKEEAVLARRNAEIALGYHPNHGRVSP
ncbi:HNH endonuclease protein [Rhizobium phage RHph_Y25]|nr:HNH endonuclease protein [Rhizobium phage RHph_Y25]